MNRRALLLGLAALPVAGATLFALRSEAAAAAITVWKDPYCGCCGAWVDHMRAAGFSVTVDETADMGPVKERLGVPRDLGSCHTAEVDGYVLEGHVPADAVKRLLAERPEGRGLSVPGMPIGSPGMEVPGAPEDTYAVVLFGESGARAFETYRGGTRIG